MYLHIVEGGFNMLNIICFLGGLSLIGLVNYLLLFSNQPDHNSSVDQYGYDRDS